ncbi:MAG: family 10 glycosylhydrolase [Janthinobacterium lividum]
MRSLRFALLTFALFLFALPLFAQSPPPPDRPELRAIWVDGFNDGFKTPAQCDLLLARLRAMHANAVFVQMRKRADAYYESHYEQWALDDPAQFDALAYLCQHAHESGKPRIQVHAWINACAVGGNASAGALTKRHPEWLSLSDTGADFDGEATKIDPGNPQAADWTFRIYLDVVRHYDVDGIHMDFIRYGGDGKNIGHWGYNAVSVARYNKRYGTLGKPIWNDPRWQAWRREQVTDLVRRVYVTATALKPTLVVSAATICWGDAPKSDTAYETKSASYTEVFAPWRDWLREGILDLNCPMAYFGLPKSAARWAGWNTFIKDRTYGRQCAIGVGGYLNPVPTTLALIGDTRAATARGNTASGAVLYCYDTPASVNGKEAEGDTALFAALPTVWPQDVPVPAMPWKIQPTTGSLLGTLLSGNNLAPMDGTHIVAYRIDGGVLRTTVSDGNGCFEFASLPPGSYRVKIGNQYRLEALVRLGHAGWLTVVGKSAAASVTRIPGIGARLEGAAITLGEVVVSSGSDRLSDHFFVTDELGQQPIQVDAPHLVPPTIRGDKVFVTGRLHHTPGGIVLEAKAVRLVGME